MLEVEVLRSVRWNVISGAKYWLVCLCGSVCLSGIVYTFKGSGVSVMWPVPGALGVLFVARAIARMRVEVRGQEIRVYSVVRIRRIASGSVVGVTAIESPYPNPGPPCAALLVRSESELTCRRVWVRAVPGDANHSLNQRLRALVGAVGSD